ncbi:potassium channel family protein [Natribaculum luteum]|uniref:Potassium channel family protein n=1 Tax=Natribaculum luteum TaxID=1586232 RepID=A0ABD5NW90_9EURY|nr:NAD-binding protein [Natribaculum luteum]
MALWQSRRTWYYIGLVATATVVLTLTYNYGMSAWEGRPQPLYRSLEIVFQSFTTTGYGEDSPWQSPQMNLLVIGIQLTGIGLILTAVDVFAVPWLQTALAPSPPERVSGLEDHVVVCEYTSRVEVFVAELESRDREYVIVEPDLDVATELHEEDYRVVHGDPESVQVLERAGIGTATAVVADAADDTNASIVLSAREANPDVRVVTLIEDRELAEYHWIAGADEVLSPRQLVGESLAAQVPTAVTPVVDEGVEIVDDVELVELSVEPGSELCERAVGEARLRDRFGVDVIGAWFDGEFQSPIDPDATIDARTRLLVAGEPGQIEALREEASSTIQQLAPQRVLIAGYGDSGTAAANAFADQGTEVTVLDLEEKDGVDVVGDARDPDVLSEAGLENASAIIVTTGDDTTAIFTTLIAWDQNPDLEIIVRATEPENVQKLYRAGADYVQSLATVSGRMMASTVLEDEEVLAFGQQIEVTRLPVDGLAGRTLVEADVRAKTGCTVLAVERGGETITEFDPDSFRLESDDHVVLAGTDESVAEFERQYA